MGSEDVDDASCHHNRPMCLVSGTAPKLPPSGPPQKKKKGGIERHIARNLLTLLRAAMLEMEEIRVAKNSLVGFLRPRVLLANKRCSKGSSVGRPSTLL